MPGKKAVLAAVGLCFCAAWSGCDLQEAAPGEVDSPEAFVIPLHIAGTVGQYARLVGGWELPVQGYGVVIGLGTNGSKEVPPHLRKYLVEDLAKRKLGSHRWGTSPVTPARLLSDVDTAVVLVGGAVPPGAPAGTRFDVYVSALPQTQTRSLDGGVLMPLNMHLAYRGVAVAGGPSKVLASSSGAVFVNPFLDPDKEADLTKMRAGRVPGGGRVLEARPLRLQLRRPDYIRCQAIRDRINERFPYPRRAANAISSSTIKVVIPPPYRRDYERFLRLILHLPLHAGPGQAEVRAKEIAEAMELPGANHEELALVWEAMGRQTVPIFRALYASKNPPAAFHAARTGMRLGDDAATEVVLHVARSAGSSLQVPAVRELGHGEGSMQVRRVLRELLDDDNELVRVAAYESLLRLGDVTTTQRFDIAGKFKLDLVKSRRGYVIYATQTGAPRIVLFGRDMSVTKPVFFNAPGDLVTANARPVDEKLMVYRKIPRTGTYSDTFKIDFYVRTLIRTLGSRPQHDENDEIMGLGLSYSQVVSVLHRMCREGDIPAKFVLQQPPVLQRISRGTAMGRPDVPIR